MPTYSISAPDGKTYQIQGPAGATQDQVQAQVLQQHPQAARRVPVSTPRQEIARAAAPARPRDLTAERNRRIDEAGRQAARSRQGSAPKFLNSLDAGIRRSMFGIPERLGAAALRYLPSSVTGNTSNLSYSELLRATRAATNEELGQSTPGNIIGQIMGSVATGRAVGGAVSAGTRRMVASASPYIARAGNVLEKLTNLQRGQRVRNVARVSLGGAVGGGAQAAGEGSDIPTGIATGAIAAPVFHGGVTLVGKGVRALRAVARPFSGSTARAVKEVITEPVDAVRARHTELEAQTGAPVPVVAALREQDFRRVVDKVVRRTPEATEAARGHAGTYVRGFMDRMLRHVNNAGREGNAQNTSIGELAQLRRDTADELMHPIRKKTVDLTQLPLDDLERQVTRQIGGRIQGLAPRINEALRDLHPDDLNEMGVDAADISAARRLMTQWGMGQPVKATVQEMDSLRRALDAAGRSSHTSNPANAMAFRNASKTVRDFVSGEVPAYGQMVDTFAAQSRMMEGFEAAAGGKRIADIEDDLLRTSLRTPEGRVGMKAGELYRQREAVTGRTTGAIAAARDFAAQGKLTRPASLEPGAAQPGTVTENLGEAPAAGLARASQGETAVLGRMVDTDRVNAMAKDEAGALSPEQIVYGAFLGNALASTKARFISSIISHFADAPVSKKVANNLADMLFSQDPAKTAQAMRALARTGLGERAVTSLMKNALPADIAIGALAAGGQGGDEEMPEAPSGDAPSVEADLGGLEEAPPDGEIPEGEIPEELQGAPQPDIPGNLPLDPQMEVHNEDGSVSTVRTISIGTDQGEVLIPTVINDRVVSDEEAIRYFQKTGENFGTFKTPDEADAYAQALHLYHQRLTGGGDQDQGDEPAGDYVPYGRQVIESVFPDAVITQDNRDPDSKLGRANPDSYHNTTDGAVDVRPIPGMTFNEFIDRLREEGHDNIIEAIDEVNHPSKHATGPHWHVVFG